MPRSRDCGIIPVLSRQRKTIDLPADQRNENARCNGGSRMTPRPSVALASWLWHLSRPRLEWGQPSVYMEDREIPIRRKNSSADFIFFQVHIRMKSFETLFKKYRFLKKKIPQLFHYSLTPPHFFEFISQHDARAFPQRSFCALTLFQPSAWGVARGPRPVPTVSRGVGSQTINIGWKSQE